MKKVKGVFIVILVLAVLVFVVMGASHMRKQVCESFVIKIENAGENKVLTPSDVEKLLRASGEYPVGKIQQTVKRPKLEAALSQNVWFDSIRSLSRHGNELILILVIKKPLVRVFPSNGPSYLIDTHGNLLPDGDEVLDRLPVLSGSIKTVYKPKISIHDLKEPALKNAFKIITAVEADKVAAAQFTQFFAHPNGEIDMYSIIGGQIIRVGTPERIDEKLQDVQTIYSEVLSYMNLEEYSQLDVRYKNRIYATKIAR